MRIAWLSGNLIFPAIFQKLAYPKKSEIESQYTWKTFCIPTSLLLSLVVAAEGNC